MSSNEPVATPKTGKQTDFFRLCSWLYALYAISVVLDCWTWTMIPGFIAPMIALALAYAYRNDAVGTPFESHLRWVIRTFWIGGAVYLPIATIIGVAVIGPPVWGELQAQLLQGKTNNVQEIVQNVMDKNYRLFTLTSLAVFAPFGLWLLWRCWQGYDRLKDNKPMENVERWY